jgi:cytochrome c peroxidase
VRLLFASLSVLALALPAACQSYEDLDEVNPVLELPDRMVGHDQALADLKSPPDPKAVRLGRWLYYDTRLSGNGNISCATCHIPEHGFSEPTPVSTGIRGQKGGRKAPSFLNAAFAFYPETFWDGRASGLEEQAKGPIENPIEMGTTHAVVVATIGATPGYAPFFEETFGDPEVTIDRIASAIAEYERTRISGNSAYDRWLEYDDEEDGPLDEPILTPEQDLGRELFFGDAKCATCHVGVHFTDSLYHNLGIGWDAEAETLADEGRFVITGKVEDMGAFKTPGLREVTLRAPYMHDGSLATLEEVMEHYRIGGIKNPQLSPKMFELELTDEEAAALVAFMHALNGEGYMDTAPELFPN